MPCRRQCRRKPRAGHGPWPELCLLAGLYVFVRQHALRNFLHSHREVILRARFDERRRIVVEGAFAELVVVVVDLPGTLRGHDDKRIARVDVLEQIVYAGMNHRFGMVAAGTAYRRTRPESSPTARSRSSFSTMWSKRSATVNCSRATLSRSPIS